MSAMEAGVGNAVTAFSPHLGSNVVANVAFVDRLTIPLARFASTVAAMEDGRTRKAEEGTEGRVNDVILVSAEVEAGHHDCAPVAAVADPITLVAPVPHASSYVSVRATATSQIPSTSPRNEPT